MKKNKLVSSKIIINLLAVILLFVACAREMSPTGGPKDETPPIPIKSHPVNYSVNFNEQKIQIQFDEFIVLKNVKQELLISPPLKEKPTIKLRGKTMLVKLNNVLKDSTTYGLNFYNAITDLNEGNVLKNFQFEFSTGSEFDSLYLGGTMQDAFNYTTTQSLLVLLYENNADSTPRKTIPAYVAKTDEDGHFFITNLKKRPYYIFGLNDMNNNMKFDLPNEGIAFLDSSFAPEYKQIEVSDTFKIIQSISANLKDTVLRDSVVNRIENVTTIGDIRLFMFVEDNAPQYFNASYRPEAQKIILSFNREIDSNFQIRPLINESVPKHWFLQEATPKADSMVYWLTDSLLFRHDSLQFQIQYTMKDSNNLDYIKTDTILTLFQKKEEVKKEEKGGKTLFNLFGGNKEEVKKDTIVPSELTFICNAKSPFDLNSNIELTSRFPIKKYNEQSVRLFKLDDTLAIPREFRLIFDEASLRKFTLSFQKDEEEKFKLVFPAGTFTDIYGNANDSLGYEFATRALDYYSTIKIHIIEVHNHSIIQLLDEKETLIEERQIDSDTTLNYSYLPPKKLVFKLFYDSNKNGKWDTGNLKERKQPEQVFYFPQEIDTKSNWDYEYDWDLYPVSPYSKNKTSKKGLKEKEEKKDQQQKEDDDSEY